MLSFARLPYLDEGVSHVLPAVVKQLIGRLDPGSFSAFVEALLTAEGARVGTAAGALVSSDAITENDEGLDALMEDVPLREDLEPGSVLPEGLVGFQFKATRNKQPSALRLNDELAKKGPLRLFERGGTYVLVRSQDLNPAQHEAVRTVLDREARAAVADAGIASEPRTAVWDAQTLAGLSGIHVTPSIDIGLADFGVALTLDELLTMLRADEREFQSDQPRTDAITRLRERARTAIDDALVLELHGDPGAGKTRVVAHALDEDDLRDSVLYVNGADGLQTLLTTLIRNQSSRGILFADEVDQHDAAEARKRVGGLAGRWRIVSVMSRSDSQWVPPGARSIVLPPLDAEATRTLVGRHAGLPEPQAKMVADVASGFPELAFRLADELRADPNLDLVHLARMSSPHELLSRALSDPETRRHLAPIALFTGVGFDGDVRYQLDEIAQAFGLDPTVVEHQCDRELGRFVSRAGRYRLVSPLLVAVWLATDLIENTPGFVNTVFSLSRPLQDAFIQQLDFFGPDVPHLPNALKQVLDDERFRRPEPFDEAAGRLLRASAAIVPTQVAAAISELLQHADDEDLERLPRRDLVWSLEILLWWEDTWERAIASLFALAEAENETWANNATSQFASAFSIYLAGTTVPYERRARWLRRAIERALPEQLPLLADAAAAGLRTHHVRSVVGFRGGGEPEDWQPRGEPEYIAARRTAWELLVLVRDRAPDELRDQYGARLEKTIRVAYGSGLAADVEDSIRSRTWSVRERAAITAGLRDVLRYDKKLSAEVQSHAEALHDWLLGDDPRERALVVLSTSLWDLHETTERVHEPPQLLLDVAAQLADDPDGVGMALGLGRDLEQKDTRFSLFRLLAQRLGAERLGEEAFSAGDVVAMSAAMSVADGAGEAAWATHVLHRFADTEPERVPELLTYVDVTPDRLELVLDVVQGRPDAGAALGRLLFGARVRDLEEGLVERVLHAVRAGGATEAALGMLDQWLEANAAPSQGLRRIAGELAIAGVESDGGTMVEFYVTRLVQQDLLDFTTLLAVWKARLRHISGLVEELDIVLTERLLREEPERMAEPIFDVVRTVVHGDPSYGLYASTDLSLLTRLAAAASADWVWDQLAPWPEDELRWAVHHMDWSGNQPEPLIRQFLLSDRLQELVNEASVCFFNTLGVVMGPYHLALERELERARAWAGALEGTSAAGWAADLVDKYQRDITWHREREAEEEMRLR